MLTFHSLRPLDWQGDTCCPLLSDVQQLGGSGGGGRKNLPYFIHVTPFLLVPPTGWVNKTKMCAQIHGGAEERKEGGFSRE